MFEGKTEKYVVSSDHHQMMHPFNLNHSKYEILGYSEEISSIYQNGNEEEISMTLEPEVIWFPETKSLCVQSHPEWQSPTSPFVSILNKIINTHING